MLFKQQFKRSFFSLTLLSLLILFKSSISYSQSAEQKVLLKELKSAKEDTNKVNLLNKMSALLVDEGDVYQSLVYAWKGLSLSKKLDDDFGIIVSYSNLGYTYGYKGENEMAIKMYRKSLFYSRKIKHTISIIDAYINLGTIYDTKSDYKKSLRYYFYALNYAKRKNDTDLLADIYQNIGITYYSLGNLPESLKMYYESLRNYELLKNEPEKVDVYNAIGNVYADQHNNDKAIAMYQKSLTLALKFNEIDGIGNAYVNLGLIYSDLNKTQKAIKMFDKAILLFEKLEDLGGLSIAYNSKAKLCYKTKAYNDALFYANEALKNSTAIDEISESTNANLTKANVFIEQGKIQQARALINTALKQSFLIQEKANIRDTYLAFIHLDSASNDFKSAFEHQKKWLIYRDSIINKVAEEKNYQTVLQYKFEKKAQSIKAKNDKAIAQLNEQNKLSSQRTTFLVILLIVFSISAFIIWYFARRSINNRKQLSIFLANENQHKELLLQEVHHRVNNSLQMISSLLTIQADTTENTEIRDYLLKSENRIQSMSVMHQLLHHGESKLEVNMQDYLKGVLDFYSNILESKPKVILRTNIPSVSFHTKLAMPLAIVLNELITNSLKYAFPNDEGEINVGLIYNKENDLWDFSVKDNGIGFSNNTESFKQSSLGLTLVRLMAQQIEGELIVQSDQQMAVIIRFKNRG